VRGTTLRGAELMKGYLRWIFSYKAGVKGLKITPTSDQLSGGVTVSHRN